MWWGQGKDWIVFKPICMDIILKFLKENSKSTNCSGIFHKDYILNDEGLNLLELKENLHYTRVKQNFGKLMLIDHEAGHMGLNETLNFNESRNYIVSQKRWLKLLKTVSR